MNQVKKLSVIIINYNTPEMTEKAVRNFIDKEKNLDAEIILIDNGSDKKVAEEKIKDLGVRPIINKENLGFAKAVNQGIKISSGDFILFLNSDVLIEKEAVSKMLEYIKEDGKAGIVAPKLIYPDGKIQPSFGKLPTLSRELSRFFMLGKIFWGGTLVFPNFFNKNEFKNIHTADWVSGGSMLIRRKVIDDIGLLDENYFFGVEDMDLCLRAARASWKVVYFPFAGAIHYHGFSSGGKRSVFGLEQARKGMGYFYRKFFPEKIISRMLINLMFEIKIFFIKLR